VRDIDLFFGGPLYVKNFSYIGVYKDEFVEMPILLGPPKIMLFFCFFCFFFFSLRQQQSFCLRIAILLSFVVLVVVVVLVVRAVAVLNVSRGGPTTPRVDTALVEPRLAMRLAASAGGARVTAAATVGARVWLGLSDGAVLVCGAARVANGAAATGGMVSGITGAGVRIHRVHAGPVNAIVRAAHGLVVTVSSDNGVVVFGARSEAMVHAMTGHVCPVYAAVAARLPAGVAEAERRARAVEALAASGAVPRPWDEGVDASGATYADEQDEEDEDATYGYDDLADGDWPPGSTPLDVIVTGGAGLVIIVWDHVLGEELRRVRVSSVIRALAVFPGDPGTVWAGTEQGLASINLPSAHVTVPAGSHRPHDDLADAAAGGSLHNNNYHNTSVTSGAGNHTHDHSSSMFHTPQSAGAGTPQTGSSPPHGSPGGSPHGQHSFSPEQAIAAHSRVERKMPQRIMNVFSLAIVPSSAQITGPRSANRAARTSTCV
jgi:hypothetical protein